MKYIGLLDCNNFFVSCERLFRPDLVNKPVVVLSSNDGCIVARSKEIKDKGIPMGVPYFQIKDILQEMKATSFSSHFALYRDISRRVFEVVVATIGEVEQYSVDECFFTIDSENLEQKIFDLKNKVESLVGIPVSIGISSSKTRAKYVNTIAKKTNGIAIWDESKWQSHVAEIQLSELWGVGSERTKHFRELNLKSVADFLALESASVSRLFGVEGMRLRSELLGVPAYGVVSKRAIQKSVTSTRSFHETSSSYSVIEDSVMYHLYQVVKDLEWMDLLTKTLRVAISPGRYSDFALQGASQEVVLSNPTRDLFVLQKAAKGLLESIFKPDVPYKKAGVVLSNLVSPQSVTPSLFNEQETKSNTTNELSEMLFLLNQKHGESMIQLGRLRGRSADWSDRKSSISPSYTTNWNELKVVKA